MIQWVFLPLGYAVIAQKQKFCTFSAQLGELE